MARVLLLTAIAGAGADVACGGCGRGLSGRVCMFFLVFCFLLCVAGRNKKKATKENQEGKKKKLLVFYL